MRKLIICTSLIILVACSQGQTNIEKGDLSGTGWKLFAHALTDIWREVPDDVEITIHFEDGEIHGSSGCNSFFGTYTQDGKKVSIVPGGLTMMACEPEVMDEEDVFLDQLENVKSFSFGEENTLTLNIDAGKGVYMMLNPHQSLK